MGKEAADKQKPVRNMLGNLTLKYMVYVITKFMEELCRFVNRVSWNTHRLKYFANYERQFESKRS
jgi:hypothetical protein